MDRRREWLAGVVLAGVSVLMACGAIELGVRALHLVPDRFWAPDPVRGARLIAGHAGWWTQEEREFVVPVRINALGLRDAERVYAKPPGVFRILVLGDSFVEAMHVPLEATFPRLLESRLRTAAGDTRVEVISAGVSGYGTASEVLYFEQDGKRFAPDLVVLAFYPGNDVKNNSPTLEDKLRPVYVDGRLARVDGDDHTGQRRGMLARSAAYQYIRQVVLTRQPALAQALVRLGVLRADALRRAPDRAGVPVDYWVYAPTADAEWAEAWTHTEHLLDRLRQSVDAAGARFAIAVLSAREQVYPESWQAVLAAHPAMASLPWDLDAPQRRVETWCAQHQVPCVTLAGPFREAAQAGAAPLHFHYDGHFTPAGHQLAARVLADSLAAQGVGLTVQRGAQQ